MSSEIDKLIGAVPPVLDDELRAKLRFDLVSQINSPDTIAKRYGFDDEASLVVFLRDNPGLLAEIQKLRAMFSSEMSTSDRARLKAQLASEELVPDIYGIVANSATPNGVRIDAFKQLNRMAGIDGMPAAAKDGSGGSGTQFNLTIHMPGGETQQIITTVANEELPAPPQDDEE